jgi:LmbE family N-acetylglucosaminyl deacetylase
MNRCLSSVLGVRSVGRNENISSMTKSNRIVVLSPHSDDAVWSIGGAFPLLRSGNNVVIVTLFDGDPRSESLTQCRNPSEHWRTFGDTAMRRDEDVRAAQRLGCELLSLGYIDAAMRLNQDGTFKHASLDALLKRHEPNQEAALSDRIERKLRKLLLPGDQILAPLGFGGHVDHQVTHELARRLPGPTAYYAEFPYYLPERRAELNILVASLGLKPEPHLLTCDWQAWIDASRCYRSQIVRMFGTDGRFLEALTVYAHDGGTSPHCRIWSIHSR